ncbi:MAG TPA: AraC family transcriptional regulator [Polyangia bacterium]|nr:AraC family transcriptional regulator [Polyangia bacterium]
MPPTVAVQVVKALLARAAALGERSVAGRVSVDAAVFDDVDGRVPAPIVRALWEELPVACGDPWFGLSLAAGVPDASLGILAAVILHAPTLEQGFRASVRYARLLQDVAACHVEPAAHGGLSFVQEPAARGLVPPRHAVEFAFARAVLMARRSTGVEIVPRAVRFAFAEPALVDRYAELFGARVTFGGARNELELDAATLALPQRQADPWLRALVEQRARALLARLGPETTFAARVAVAVARAIHRGVADLDVVARELRIGPRTLQRNLTREGRTFRAVVDEARRELAKQALADRRESLAQIALLLGFSEQTAFHRAFVRWTGKTPGQFRRES